MPIARTVLTLASALLGATALAGSPPATADLGERLEPLRVARVKFDGGRVVLDGGWSEYSAQRPRSNRMYVPAFDCVGLSSGLGPMDPGAQYCPSPCDKGLLLEVPHPSPNVIEDMQAVYAPGGVPVSGLVAAWHWTPPAPRHLVIVYVFFNNVLKGCPDPAGFSPTGPGVAIDFGLLRPTPFFYYTYVLNLDMLGVLFPWSDRDHDGHPDGSYQMMLATDLTEDGPVFPDFPAFPVLAATGDATGQCRVGRNNAQAYDDALPPDNVFTSAECHSYSQGVCPSPLGKANAFFYYRCPADINADGFVDGTDVDVFYRALEVGGCAAEFNGDCFVDGGDVDRFFNELESPCE